ncbi:hypothetical protein Tco_0767519 [Tanacetum coccineum]
MEVGGMRLSCTCCAFWIASWMFRSMGVKLVKFLVYLVSSHGCVWDNPWEMTYGNGFELLGGMSLKEDRVVWMVVDGGKVRARIVSNVVAMVVLLLLGVEELALEAIEYDDQDE